LHSIFINVEIKKAGMEFPPELYHYSVDLISSLVSCFTQYLHICY